MVTALAWVSRGFAKKILDNYEPTDQQLTKHQKLQGKIAKKSESKDINQVAKELEGEIDKMDLEDDDSEGDAPIFTPELAKLKAKELG